MVFETLIIGSAEVGGWALVFQVRFNWGLILFYLVALYSYKHKANKIYCISTWLDTLEFSQLKIDKEMINKYGSIQILAFPLNFGMDFSSIEAVALWVALGQWLY